jgi:hypothetical protein
MKHLDNILERKKEILSWPHVTAEPHRFGGLEFKYDKRDFPFPLQLRKELVSQAKCLYIMCFQIQDGLAIG